MEISDIILISSTVNFPELKPSKLFFKDDKMFITKYIDGELITKEASKDFNYNGNRYDWIENLK